jgi:hypothetical protein
MAGRSSGGLQHLLHADATVDQEPEGQLPYAIHAAGNVFVCVDAFDRILTFLQELTELGDSKWIGEGRR